MAKKKIYQLDTHSVISDTDVLPISWTSGNGEKVTAGELATYVQWELTSLDATQIADWSVSDTEFQYLNGVSSNIQTQLDAKATNAFAIAQAVALG